MYTRISKNDFMEAFRNVDRYDQFGYAALSALFDYFENEEEVNGVEIELDVIAICGDYTVSTIKEVRDEYDLDEYDLDEDTDILEYLMNNTLLVAALPDGRILYQSF